MWEHRDVREALAAFDFGALCRLLRRYTGWRQSDLAALLGMNQGILSQIERNVRRLTDIDKIRAFLQALGTPPELSPLHPRSQPTTPPPPGASDLTARAAADSLAFTQQITPGNVDDQELEYLSLELSRIAIAYVHSPVLPLFTDLLIVRDRTFHLIQGPQRPTHRSTLLMLAGTACLLLAHASQNIGDDRSALVQLHTAYSCADQADHRGLKAWVRATYALFAEWSPRRRQALTFTHQAWDLAPPGDSRIRIAAIEARTAARLGDHDRALHALARMHTAQAETPVHDELSELGGILTFPRAKQEYYEGAVHSLLEDHTTAEQHASEALRRYAVGPAEQRSYGDEALALIDVVTARLALGDLHGASELLERILTLPPTLRIQQLQDRLHRVRAMLQHPALRHSPAARQLAELTRGYEVISTHTPIPSSR
ncbi:helix-turn-helix domain-containing protein [Streptomyces roseifaciens]|uniref:helix-turn-helix domain-containing protein n=1 Tax=Streptomyces roseifaciens TaxID=1488406 RepID=UPI00071822BA|nr:helix-turn-helix transcriptional regulator [Streptomyces roseifaciens]